MRGATQLESTWEAEIEETGSRFAGSNGIVVLKPIQGDTRTWLDDFHQDLVLITHGLRNKTLILDLSNLETIPLSLIGMAYALKEELLDRDCGFFLTGIRPDAVSGRLWLRVIKSLNLFPQGDCQRKRES